jgi:hypothetical protein
MGGEPSRLGRECELGPVGTKVVESTGAGKPVRVEWGPP